jgi:anti-sigma regulatory factor (Ser/Thr protein kinase)
MREISLHILDIVQNSVEAGATRVDLLLTEDRRKDTMEITIADNGRGMDPEFVACVLDPFVTSRTTRHVGLGLPLLRETAEQSGGHLKIDSVKGEGTTVNVVMQHSHIDRPPLGDMKSTLLSIIVGNSIVDLHYVHRLDGETFELDSAEIKRTLDGVPLSDPAVLRWLREFLDQDLTEVAS